MKIMRYITLIICIIFLNACATKMQDADKFQSANQADAKLVWDKFVAYSNEKSNIHKPYRIQAYLRYSEGESTKRANAIIWSNDESPSRLPLRLDIMASVGASILKFMQNNDEIIYFFPQENKALMHSGRGSGFISFGMNVPFSVQDFVAVLQGRFLDALANVNYDSALVFGNDIRYGLSNDLLLTLNSSGKPVLIQDTANNWDMSITYKAENVEKISIIHNETNELTLEIKKYDFVAPFNAKQLHLALPDGVNIQKLRNGKE